MQLCFFYINVRAFYECESILYKCMSFHTKVRAIYMKAEVLSECECLCVYNNLM